jgi:phosphoenolpyruvate synthase/pyruvate phosphate dikinase
LVSVRSGAKFSMPGMMDTILNLGLNDDTVVALERKSGNPRFSQDCYRRFIQMFGNVVLDIEKHDFDAVFEGRKKKAKAKFDTDLTAAAVVIEWGEGVADTTPQRACEQAYAAAADFYSTVQTAKSGGLLTGVVWATGVSPASTRAAG